MSTIDAKARNVRELLGGKKYTIDYFQREYRWTSKEMAELIADLTQRFSSAWRKEHARKEVAKYPAYYLGSIIVSGEGGRLSVIDGQQRLTSLSILLIWVLHGLEGDEDKRQIADLIFTRQFGENAYNLDVPERAAAMEALYQRQPFNRDDAPESVRNILDRYEDISEQMPETIKTDARAMFADWLIERVYLVEIKSPSDDDGYAIFETMNDRGLALSSTDMLKSHLLANCGGEEDKKRLNALWKGRVDELLQLGREEEADAIKSWLRARHAETIREREAGAQPQDFDRIGTEFHRWVRDNCKSLRLTQPADFKRYVETDFNVYSNWYLRLRRAAKELTEGRETIYCNALANFTLQYPLMLAPILVTDSEETGWRKALTVASFIDILIARRLWNGKSIDYSTMQYAMFLALKEIRGKTAEDMAAILRNRLDQDAPPFEQNPRFGLWQSNKKTIRRFLARMTSWLDQQLGIAGTLPTYLSSTGKNGFDIEHIMADKYDRHADEFPAEIDFQETRDRIGGLLLLPRSFNRSYGDLTYEAKRPHYLQMNSLAQTLHDQTYSHNPGLRRVINELGIPFEPLAKFRKADLEKRQTIMLKIAETVWSLNRLDAAARGEA